MMLSPELRRFAMTKPDPKQTRDQVSDLNPSSLPRCQLFNPPQPSALKTAVGVEKPYPTWGDIGQFWKSRKGHSLGGVQPDPLYGTEDNRTNGAQSPQRLERAIEKLAYQRSFSATRGPRMTSPPGLQKKKSGDAQ